MSDNGPPERPTSLDAFQEFFQKEYNVVLNSLWRVSWDRETAEDATMVALFKAWEHWQVGLGRDDMSGEGEGLQDRNPFKRAAWVKKVALNEFWSSIKVRRLEAPSTDQLPLHAAVAAGQSSVSSERLIELRDAWKQALFFFADLPEQRRNVAALYLIAGYEYDEIADLLDISPTTVRVHVSRVRDALREAALTGRIELPDGVIDIQRMEKRNQRRTQDEEPA